MSRTLPWQLWPGRHYPLAASEEAAFVADLRLRSVNEPPPIQPRGGTKVLDRDITTVLLGALRCGSMPTEVLGLAPGLRCSQLVRKYDELEVLRGRAEEAWRAIIDSPTVATISEHAAAAARLLPVPVYDLVNRGTIVNPEGLELAVSRTAAHVEELGRQVRAVESDLERGLMSGEALIERGRVLYDPYVPGLWANPYFLPDRVGTLTPVRLADLLGERSRM